MLHPRTIYRLIQDFESNDGSSRSLSEDEELEHSIISVQIEHFAYNENETFMIAKTIEEMKDNEDNYNVVHTLRIYKEILDAKFHPDLFQNLN